VTGPTRGRLRRYRMKATSYASGQVIGEEPPLCSLSANARRALCGASPSWLAHHKRPSPETAARGMRGAFVRDRFRGPLRYRPGKVTDGRQGPEAWMLDVDRVEMATRTWTPSRKLIEPAVCRARPRSVALTGPGRWPVPSRKREA